MTGRGIAGSREPEAAGVFVCPDEFDAQFFTRFADEPVDMWSFDADESALVATDSGYSYLPGAVAPERLTLHRSDIVAPPIEASTNGGAYSSTLTITYDEDA